MWARQDAARYRKGYPGWEKRDNKKLRKNIDFYEGRIPSSPEGGFIDDIHTTWFGDYRLLELHHGYIQWLFPIREDGLNHRAQRLQTHEVKYLQQRPKLQEKIILSYEMMLDFYGMKLADPVSGKVKRGKNWRDRYRHLDRSFHNYLRITRILKCLGEVGLEHLKPPFVRHIMKEIGKRQLTNCFRSLSTYWVPVIKNDEIRVKLEKQLKEVDKKSSSFKWKLRRRGVNNRVDKSRVVSSEESSSEGEQEKEEDVGDGDTKMDTTEDEEAKGNGAVATADEAVAATNGAVTTARGSGAVSTAVDVVDEEKEKAVSSEPSKTIANGEGAEESSSPADQAAIDSAEKEEDEGEMEDMEGMSIDDAIGLEPSPAHLRKEDSDVQMGVDVWR